MASVTVETEALMAFAVSLADAAREILLPAMPREREVSIKSDESMVTKTDLAIETRLREMIDATYPTHGVRGEEHGSRDEGAEFVWVLDPIDGTAPFVAGIPVFGTLIGLARGGRPFLGVIDHPATDERWCGMRGEGATLNGRGVRTRACAGFATAFMTNSNPDFFTPAEAARFKALHDQVRYTQYGASCYGYAMLATGRTDIGIDAALDPFDIFAPAAVIEAAGGRVTDWDGEPITLAWGGQVVATGDPRLHEQVLAVLDESRSE